MPKQETFDPTAKLPPAPLHNGEPLYLEHKPGDPVPDGYTVIREFNPATDLPKDFLERIRNKRAVYQVCEDRPERPSYPLAPQRHVDEQAHADARQLKENHPELYVRVTFEEVTL